MGQACIAYTDVVTDPTAFDDVGQWRSYSAEAKAYGKTGDVFYESKPVVYYSKVAQ